MLNVILGIALGLLMVPLVYLLASRLLTGAAPMPRTGLAPWAFVGACLIAGLAVITLTGSVATVIAYALFSVGALAAAAVDVVERRIPNKITYPLILAGVLALPWLNHPITWWMMLTPLVGALASGIFALINAMVADQGLGDVKLAAAIGAWMAHLGLVAWVAGLVLAQLLMVAAVAGTRVHRHRAGLPPDYTPLGPSLAGAAVCAVTIAAFVG